MKTRLRIPRSASAALLLGACSQVGQVLLLRELLMVFHGSELSIGLILASWLAWVGIGSSLGARLLRRTDDARRLLLISAAGILLSLPGTILVARLLRGILALPYGSMMSLGQMATVCLVTMAPACLLLGLQFVVVARIWRESRGATDTSGAAWTYVVEAVGSMLGGVAFTFVLVHRLGALQSAALVGALMLALALLSYGWRRAWLALLVAALLLPLLGQADAWAYRLMWQLQLPGHQLAGVFQSRHGIISLLEREGQYSFFQSGHLILSAAGADAEHPGLEDQEAVTLAHLAMLQHPQPERVLLIGGGLRGTLAEIIKHPVLQVDYVELDPALIRAARPVLASSTERALADPRVRVLHTDGRRHVRTSPGGYDLVIADVPDPLTAVVNRFYTAEFFAQVRQVMTVDGVLAIGASSTADLRATTVANRNAAIYHTLSSEFDQVLAVGERFVHFFAGGDAGQISSDPELLSARYRQRGIVAQGFSEHHLATILLPGQLERLNWLLDHHGRRPDSHLTGPPRPPLLPGDRVPGDEPAAALDPVSRRFFINSDMSPILYFHSLLLWDELTRHRDGSALQWALLASPTWVLLLLPLALLAAATTRWRGGASAGLRFAVRFSVFTTGLSTMALQVAILFAFQSIYGFIYEMVGLIIAVFMLGLALGALTTAGTAGVRASVGRLALLQLVIAAVAALIALALPATATISAAAVLPLFAVLTLVSGFINGLDFPLSLAVTARLSGDPDRAAASVYGVELAGACIGAAAASVVVVPVLGIVACCLMASFANATALVILLVCGRR